jgi:hypothetical protein
MRRVDDTLMHREIAVAALPIDETVAAVTKIGAVWRPAHLPIGIPVSAWYIRVTGKKAGGVNPSVCSRCL